MRIVILVALTLSLTGCSSFGRKLKAFLGGKSAAPQASVAAATGSKYSDNPNMYTGIRRNYKRVTKQTLEDEALLDNRSGSLWVMEGQGAYLFSQNIMRMVGDPIAVTIEGEPREQLSSKVGVISKLWAKYEERSKVRAPAAAPGKAEPAADESKDVKSAEATEASKVAQQQPQQKQTLEDFNVRNVPTRIVERTPDGNYRVKGSQPFMIGTREYRVIVTGVVRAEDFNDEGISAGRLLDAKFDVVSARRQEGM